jgi:tagaturonate reductase
LTIPTDGQFHLPEKVLQFGTGVLLRGLPDHYIDRANRNGTYGGRIVVVKSTDSGGTEAYAAQDSLYTLLFRGVRNGLPVDRAEVNASISRVLRAKDDWQALLRFAESPDWELVLSNTTEAGIVMSDEDVRTGTAPHSFPGKLLALMHHRYLHFGGEAARGLVIIPTELIEQNGRKLRAILLAMSEANGLSEGFIEWLDASNHFCDSLVDRIVPGAPSPAERAAKERAFGFSDGLMVMAEPYGLWAIESSAPEVLRKLGFCDDAEGCLVVPSIERYRECKLRLLNGTHTFSCGIALLAGCTYVRDAVVHPEVGPLMKRLLEHEILPLAREGDPEPAVFDAFAWAVWDRFCNPHLDHRWVSISAQFTSKMRMRNLPLMLRALEGSGRLPEGMLMGFCAYLLCMDTEAMEPGGYKCDQTEPSFPLVDAFAERLHRHWSLPDTAASVRAILSDLELWGVDLTRWPGFEADVVDRLGRLSTRQGSTRSY